MGKRTSKKSFLKNHLRGKPKIRWIDCIYSNFNIIGLKWTKLTENMKRRNKLIEKASIRTGMMSHWGWWWYVPHSLSKRLANRHAEPETWLRSFIYLLTYFFINLTILFHLGARKIYFWIILWGGNYFENFIFIFI